MGTQTHTLPVFFTTQTPYPLPLQKFMIPASWNRYQLSQLVNKVLALARPIPFDFILKKSGQLLRGSLQEWCETGGVGMEGTLEIEYVESLLPPTRLFEIPHDDWISDLSLGIQGHFVTASYDGLLRVFDSSQTNVHTVAGHAAAATSVIILPSASDSLDGDNEVLLASASHDNTARFTAYNVEAKTSRALASLRIHSAPVSSISASSSGKHVLTTGWDHLIGIWDTRIPSSDEATLASVDDSKGRKRRRVIDAGDASGDAVGVKRKAPLAVLKSHTSRVMSACYCPTDEKKVYSASLDSTIRTWDVEAGICVHAQTVAEAPFVSLVHLSAPDLLAVASTDRALRIFDTRTFTSKSTSSSTAPVIFQHSSTPGALAPSPTNIHHVSSGGYDGVVRIWDIRSSRGAVASFRTSEGVDAGKRGDGKVLGLDWKNGVMAVGGEAGLDVWRVPEKAEEA